jgi:hypothetical protein
MINELCVCYIKRHLSHANVAVELINLLVGSAERDDGIWSITPIFALFESKQDTAQSPLERSGLANSADGWTTSREMSRSVAVICALNDEWMSRSIKMQSE